MEIRKVMEIINNGNYLDIYCYEGNKKKVYYVIEYNGKQYTISETSKMIKIEKEEEI